MTFFFFQSIIQHKNTAQKRTGHSLSFCCCCYCFSARFDLDHGCCPTVKQEQAVWQLPVSTSLVSTSLLSQPLLLPGKRKSCGVRTELRASFELCCQVPRFAASPHSPSSSLPIKALEGSGQTTGAQSALCPALYWANWAWYMHL